MTIQERGERFSFLLAQELKGAIAARGFTTKYVAEQLGTYAPVLSNYFNGKRALPADTLNKACEVIGMDPGELVNRAYDRLLTDMGRYQQHTISAVKNPSDSQAIFDPEELGLAAHKDTRDEDTDF